MNRRIVITTVAVIAVVTGACGNGGETAGAVDEETKREAASLAYAKCMRANGADVPDPDQNGMMTIEPGQEMPSPEAMDKAEQSCKKERKALEGVMGKPPADFQDKVVEIAKCLRGKGYDVPDPRLSSDGKAAVEIDGEMLSDPGFEKAQQDCNKQIGLNGGRGFAGGPGGSK